MLYSIILTNLSVGKKIKNIIAPSSEEEYLANGSILNNKVCPVCGGDFKYFKVNGDDVFRSGQKFIIKLCKKEIRCFNTEQDFFYAEFSAHYYEYIHMSRRNSKNYYIFKNNFVHPMYALLSLRYDSYSSVINKEIVESTNLLTSAVSINNKIISLPYLWKVNFNQPLINIVVGMKKLKILE